MAKTVTLRLDENTYKKFRILAENDNRTISNFITNSALRHIEASNLIDEYEMAEIEANDELKKSLARAHKDVKGRKGRFVG